jgi:hypothetical protein
VDAGLGNQAADHVDGGVQLCGELGQAGVVLAACHEVAVQVGEAEGMGAVVQAALLAVDDSEAALVERAAVRWWCFPALGVPGAPPLREICSAEITCSDERIVAGGEPAPTARTARHFSPVGNPAPPRPRSPLSATSWITATGHAASAA